jgi:hypothetical protein
VKGLQAHHYDDYVAEWFGLTPYFQSSFPFLEIRSVEKLLDIVKANRARPSNVCSTNGHKGLKHYF